MIKDDLTCAALRLLGLAIVAGDRVSHTPLLSSVEPGCVRAFHPTRLVLEIFTDIFK